jgi:hypothetical protein
MLALLLGMTVGYLPLVLSVLEMLSYGLAVNYEFLGLRGIDIFYCALGGLFFGLLIAKHLIAQFGAAIVVKSGAVQMTAILIASAYAGNSAGELLTLHFALGFTGATTTPMVYLKLLEKRLVPQTYALSTVICLLGLGLGLLVLPVGVRWLIDFQGWRTASVVMALLFGCVNCWVWSALFRHGDAC